MAERLKYRIIGERGPGNYKPGQIVDDDDLAGTNIQALLDGGHIVVEIEMDQNQPTKQKE